MPSHSLPRVLVFPADDVALRREVEASLAATDPTLPDDARVAAVEQHLRRWYRSVRIRTRDPFGGYPDDPTPVWYVYRDGRIRRRNPGLERLYVAMGQARETIRVSQHAVDSAQVMLRIARVTLPDEHPAGAFPPVEAIRRGRGGH